MSKIIIPFAIFIISGCAKVTCPIDSVVLGIPQAPVLTGRVIDDIKILTKFAIQVESYKKKFLKDMK